jgi:23S rRNA maturation-related 3'-5' exoribonuclease YhaM
MTAAPPPLLSSTPDGSAVPQAFALIGEAEIKTDARGRQRLTGQLVDIGGSIPFVLWEVGFAPPDLVPGDAVSVTGSMGSYRGEPQFTVNGMRRATARIWHDLCDRCEIEHTPSEPIPASLRLAVEHVILSHHGELQYGSPVTPKTPEAALVAALDRLDASMAALWAALESGRGAGKFGGEVYAAAPGVDALAVAQSPADGIRLAPAPAGDADADDDRPF